MYYIIILLVLFSTHLLIKDYKNKFAWLLVFMVLSMSISIFAVTQHIAKMGNYRVLNSPIFSLDYKFYLFIVRNMKLSLSNITRLINIGIGFYIFFLCMFVYVLSKGDFVNKMSSYKRILVLSIYPLFYLWFYSPDTGYSIFLAINSYRPQYVEPLKLTVIFLDSINKWVVFMYLCIPIFLLQRHYIDTKCRLIKKQIVALGASLSLINLFFFVFFFLGPFQLSHKNLFSYSFWNLYDFYVLPVYYKWLPFAVLVILVVVLLIYQRYKMTSIITYFKNKIGKYSIRELNANIKGVIHSHKNTFFGLKIMASEADVYYGTQKGRDSLSELITHVDITLSSFSKVLDTLSELHFKKQKIRIVDLIESACHEVHIPQHITIKRHYYYENIWVYLDLYHMTAVITNLLQNAIEAIECKGEDGGEIIIEVGSQYDWLYIQIKDTGVGISKKLVKKIYQPFYSTKGKLNNWGIGLSYVKNVIHAHLGIIDVESVEDKYTSFEILLPLINRREIYE